MAAYVSSEDYSVQDMNNPLTTIGDTIYYLHYFRHIPVIGIYLSGFVALFFFFAIVTGVLIHWRNLLTKFYAFIKEGKWKTIWTNAHTVLGVIGLPFQLIYAVTGAFFGLLTFILLPSVLLLYDGDSSKVFSKINPETAIKLDPNAPEAENISINSLIQQVHATYPDSHILRAVIRNYGREDALVTWQLDDKKGILSYGTAVMYMRDGVILEEYSAEPVSKSYSLSVISIIAKLHFGDFGGILMKIVYFILSMITCFMIISGVLLWRAARENNKYTLKQRLFHHKVTKIYLAICLSMFPAFAILFIANKLVPMDYAHRVNLVNQIFFLSWLAMIIIGSFWDSYGKQNRNYLLAGGILSLLVPIANGVVTGDWIWKVWYTFPHVAYVDLFWLFAGVASICLVKTLKAPNDSNRPIKEYTAREKSDKAPQRANKPKISIPKPEPQMAMNKQSIPSLSASAKGSG